MCSPTITLLGILALLGCTTIVLATELPTKQNTVAAASGDGGSTAPSIPMEHSSGCGKSVRRDSDSQNIRLKDNQAAYGEFPWMMIVSRSNKELEERHIAVYLCGGSLIHYQVVLTAAHCVYHNAASELRVLAAEWKLQHDIYPHLNRSVVNILYPPEHKNGYLENDVALLFLDSPFQSSEVIQPVCLPPPDAKFDHQPCFATGWGKDRIWGTHPNILKKIVLPIVPNDQCQSALRTTTVGPEYTLHKSYICAGGVPGKYLCIGDEGSPLVCPIPNKQHQYYQTGIVVFSGNCGWNGVPDTFTNVAMFRNWIDQQMVQHNFSTSSYTP